MSKALFCPQNGVAKIVHYNKLPTMEEYLTISEYHSVIYNINRVDTSPNKTLTMYGGILENIPGDAIILQCDSDGETVNIDDNILDNLKNIIKDDIKQRQKYISELTEKYGAKIAYTR
jgi:GTP cyclohydrolase III